MDIVYIVRLGDRNEHLRYSLRSLANLPHDQVWVVGYCPAWVAGVRYIRTNQVPRSKWSNARMNLRAACEHPDVSDDFMLFNDDFFIMEPTADIPPMHQGSMAEYYRRQTVTHSLFMKGVIQTSSLLAEYGIDDPLAYNVHVPMPMNKDRLLEVLDIAESDLPRDSAIHVRSLYGNYWNVGGVRVDDCKIQTPQESAPQQSPFLSTLASSFSYGLVGSHIRERFPHPSSHEIEMPMTGIVYEATTSFVCIIDGKNMMIHKGDTIREGHPIMEGREGLFIPRDESVDYDWSPHAVRPEQATAAPGELRTLSNKPTKRGRPKLPRDEQGNIVRD